VIFTFHDTTLEIVAGDVDVRVVPGPMRRVVSDLAGALYDR
jgi:hypothetical protein